MLFRSEGAAMNQRLTFLSNSDFDSLTLGFDEDIRETRIELSGDIELVRQEVLGEVGATIMEDAVEMDCSLEIDRADVDPLILRLIPLAPASEENPGEFPGFGNSAANCGDCIG